jgi:transposase InsO family protein
MTVDFCVEALEEAIARYGPSGIFNSDQGSQFTSNDFTSVLKAHAIRITWGFVSKNCGRVLVRVVFQVHDRAKVLSS